jgi:hypothetical protein
MARLLKFREVKEIFGGASKVTKFVDAGILARPLPRESDQEERMWLDEDVDAAIAKLREQRNAQLKPDDEIRLPERTRKRIRESGLPLRGF